ncbi:HetZ-related protein [Leptolyngbya sp. FACHB-541]|uniref:HetZ-related protein n=1 Tax=Leptolyngbya sp. FACHB-541 TaxID=2692810 RepID=UPI0016893D71|nr:HetZ-related protein [Leptolyngbya sp. FACHB-541]MBD1996610.1 HetZ-related protein [Leptolyngbya sp. FACHB-541]
MNVEPVNSAGSSSQNESDALHTGLQPDDQSIASVESANDEFNAPDSQVQPGSQTIRLVQLILSELQAEIHTLSASAEAVATRIATEVERICAKSDRIQTSGQIQSWQNTLARHRLQKCIEYYRLGSRRGRVDLHSHLSAIVYRHVATSRAQLGFQGRYSLIEDFLQGFYIEVLKAFRRENQLPENYSPRTRLELAEYMAFTEQYAKRRITLPGHRNQQLVVLRAQGFSRRQPPETALDIEMAVESAKGEEAEAYSRAPVVQQVREQMVADATDPAESVLRDRVVTELVQYLESQGQSDCIDYLTLKLQDLSAPEIDSILGLSARQRDYLQQRFKYHVEKFARSHRWQLVHQWLGADLDQNLGMPQKEWRAFVERLSPEQRQLMQLKGMQIGEQRPVNPNTLSPRSDEEIAKTLKCTPKQVHKRWVQILELAWQTRNHSNVD